MVSRAGWESGAGEIIKKDGIVEVERVVEEEWTGEEEWIVE